MEKVTINAKLFKLQELIHNKFTIPGIISANVEIDWSGFRTPVETYPQEIDVIIKPYLYPQSSPQNFSKVAYILAIELIKFQLYKSGILRSQEKFEMAVETDFTNGWFDFEARIHFHIKALPDVRKQIKSFKLSKRFNRLFNNRSKHVKNT